MYFSVYSYVHSLKNKNCHYSHLNDENYFFKEAVKFNNTTIPPTYYAKNTTVPTRSNKDHNFQTLEIIFICIGIILLLVTMAIGVGWLASRNKKIDYDEINESHNEDSIL